jgi:hypothetical protein
MTAKTSATTTLFTSAGVPATFDSAGYAALSWTAVGEVTNFGEIGREFNLVTHSPVANRATVKLKGSHNEGSVDLQLALDTDDAGQVLMKAAALSDNLYAFRITTAVGPLDKYYFQGLVMGWKVGVKGVNDVTSASAKIEIVTATNGVTGIVEVLG